MSIQSLTPYVLPDSTSTKTYSIMGKSCNLFDVKTMNDPFTEFLMGSETLPQAPSETSISSPSPIEKEPSEDITLLPSSDAFILTDPSSPTTTPSLILNHQPEMTSEIGSNNSNSTSNVHLGEIYTLTLGDGTAVQLRVQTYDEHVQEPVTLSDVSSTSGLPISEISPQTNLEQQSLSNIVSQTGGESMDWNASLNEQLPQIEFPLAFQNLISRDELIIRKGGSTPDEHSSNLSRVSTDASVTSSNSDDDESLHSVKLTSFKSAISKDGKVNLELLKNELNTLPDGQLNLEAILRNADVDMSVEEIVKPTLTSLKKLMSQKKFSDWQTALCLKIRRRKKNTAAVRSSRRKRVQYVYELKEHVAQLSKRRKEAELENSLLKQLKFLWERLVQEVEAEVQEGRNRRDACYSSNQISKSNTLLSIS